MDFFCYSVIENCESDWEFDKSPLGNKLHKIHWKRGNFKTICFFAFLGAYL